MTERDRPVVRRATEADLPEVARMSAELNRLQEPWRVFAPRASIHEEQHRLFQAALMDPDAILLVAEDRGVVVGMAMGHLHRPSSFSNDPAVELTSVYVRPESRQMGLARQLTAVVARFARDRGVGRVDLKTFAQNDEGIAAWRAMGFEERMIQMTAPPERLTGEP
jgi:ribosomal protein S18 acetylase RimI-like enzyme